MVICDRCGGPAKAPPCRNVAANTGQVDGTALYQGATVDLCRDCWERLGTLVKQFLTTSEPREAKK